MHLQGSPGPAFSDCSLSIVGGDFNYVVAPEDRISKGAMQWSGAKDARDQEDFIHKFKGKQELHELFQDMATHSSGLARSRLDRVYLTQHTCEQLDSRLGCSPLEWVPKLSDHRPVVFFRSRNKKASSQVARISEQAIRHVEWPKRVTLKYGDLKAEHFQQGGGNNEFTDLFTLKRAIQMVSSDIDAEYKSHINVATEVDDQLGWTMRLLRAAEKGHGNTVRKCVRAYPHLGSLVNPYDPHIHSNGSLSKVRDHALELSRASILAELRRVQADEGEADPNVQMVRRKRLQVRINKLKPGNCCSIAAVQAANGTILDDPHQIAAELRRHWKDVFADHPCDGSILAKWIREEFAEGAPWDNREGDKWHPTREDVARVIKHSGISAPGPDGIPYSAWRRLGDLAIDILFAVTQAIGKEEVDDLLKGLDPIGDGSSHTFNLGNMIFLPKKVAGTDPLLGDYYTVNDVRPLMVVNTDNRLVANTLRKRWEPIFDAWISRMQQGFLPFRSMASNIIELEARAQQVCLGKSRGAILLLDFRAAFPSISHGFLHQMLAALGVPNSVCTSVKNLYCSHSCTVNFGSVSLDGFDIQAGIRQGCPLSPLLFALTIDIVLRRLHRRLPSALVRAFADDIGIVVEDIAEALPILQEIFQDLEKIAGLTLNRPKCILIPLWPTSSAQVQRELAQHFSDWATITVAFSGTYLGVLVGPDSHDSFWGKAIKKYLDRAKSWGKLGLGLQFSTVAYCTYVLPTLSFLAQFKRPNQAVLEAEKKAINLMVPGPYCWCLLSDFHVLGSHFGQAASFPRLQDLCLAARTRLKTFENRRLGGLGIRAKSGAIRQGIRNINNTKRYARWFSWFQHGIVEDILSCEEELSQRGLEIGNLLDIAAGPLSDVPSEAEVEKRRIRQRKCFQRTIRGELSRITFTDSTERMRHKLGRWGLMGLPAHTAARCIRALQRLKTGVPPRVRSAVLRTMWNGWCTHRRFQQSGSCCFQCGSGYHEDSIEHYAHCPVVRGCATKYLRIFPSSNHTGQFIVLGVNEGIPNREDLIARALWVYATYRAHNILRFAPLAEGEEAGDLLKQLAKEGAMGHPEASAVLDSRWAHFNSGQSLWAEPRDDWDATDMDLEIFE